MRAEYETFPTTRALFRRIGAAIALLGVLPLFGCGPSAAERAKEDAAGKKITQEGAQRILQEGGRPGPPQPPPTKTYDYGKGN